MPDVRIALINPLYEGNIGFCARVMKNFGFEKLILVDPCRIGDDAIARAAHARDILSRAERWTIDEVFSRSDMTVAATGAVSKSVCHHIRMPFFTPKELRFLVEGAFGSVTILFGRENWGLSNEEVSRADVICTIPADPAYPILNLSHAVGIICYELAGLERSGYPLADREHMDHLYRHIDQFLDRIEHPDFKRANTMVMVRRVLGRSRLTPREASTLHGLMRRTEWHIDNNKTDPE